MNPNKATGSTALEWGREAESAERYGFQMVSKTKLKEWGRLGQHHPGTNYPAL